MLSFTPLPRPIQILYSYSFPEVEKVPIGGVTDKKEESEDSSHTRGPVIHEVVAVNKLVDQNQKRTVVATTVISVVDK